MSPNDPKVVPIHPELSNQNVSDRATFEIASKAARFAEEAVNRSIATFDEMRRVRQEQKRQGASIKKLGADMADNQAALLLALASMTTERSAREALSAEVQKAAFNARAAREDAKAAEDKSEEITGRYDVKELLRQSQADATDRAIVQKIATTFVTDEEKERAQEHEEKVKRSAFFWRTMREVSVIVIAVVSSVLAAKYGVAIGH